MFTQAHNKPFVFYTLPSVNACNVDTHMHCSNIYSMLSQSLTVITRTDILKEYSMQINTALGT